MKSKKQAVKVNTLSVCLAILSAVLLCGIVVGAVTSAYIENDTSKELIDSTSRSISLLSGDIDAINLLPSTLWNVFKYPLFVFVLGFTVLGVGLVPLAVALRGFFLAFSVGTVIKLYGTQGIWLALSLFGPQALISLPCLLIIASQSFISARAQMRLMSGGKRVMIGSVFPRGYFIIFGVCIFILSLLVFLEIFVTPQIVAFTASNMLK